MDLDTSELEAIALENWHNASIHDTDRIQSFGCLLGLSLDGTQILYASVNTTEFFGPSAEAVLEMSPTELLGAEQVHDIRNIVGRSTSNSQRELVGEVETICGSFNMAVHRQDDVAILEVTIPGDSAVSVAEALNRLRWLTSKLDQSNDFDELLTLTVQYLRSISGYDRVMTVWFRPDGSTEVLAEDRNALVESFLGLRFPEEDIPQQRSQSYIENPIQFIADVQQESVALISKPGRKPPDLSRAILRGRAPEYKTLLRNMDLGAVMTLPIVIDEELRGFFKFHHESPRHPSGGMEQVLELVRSYVVLLGNSTLERQITESQQRSVPMANSLVVLARESSATANSIRPALAKFGQLIPSVGVAYISGSIVAVHGRHPDEAILGEVTDALQPVQDGILMSEALGESISADRLGGIAGALSISFGPTNDESIVFFREATTTTVQWAGSPDRAIDLTNGQPQLLPRESFAAFEQTVEGRAHSWEDASVVAARGLQRALRSAAPVISADRDALVENLELVVQELNHRVRNILALVQSIVGQTRPESTALSESFDSVVSESFDSLERRIFALATAHNILSESGARSLNLRDALRRESDPYDPERVTVDGPSVGILAEVAPMFVLVIHELFSNAAKYGALSTDEGTLTIRWHLLDDGLHLEWTELGGPSVSAPTRTGFGHALVANALSYQTGGTTEIEFRPEGFFCRIRLPKTALTSTVTSEQVREQVPRPLANDAPQVLDGDRVLLLEDDFLIAIQTEDQAKSLGAKRVLPASNTSTALQLLTDETIDFAILDINLGTERSTPVAAKLVELGIPFVFVTGYDSGVSWLADFDEVTVVRKPVTIDSLQVAVAETKNRHV